ncbi:MAG: bifunctional (p)ppGpp synthetase/guanosine-3',5'-bis(diphosphate) 3'-pyrophosphohydrolase [Deltaproteobacteria bacterium]|jgi:GTP pyrophosphokinase|nr:bifunctional (p)ppGpp synthetase/guanosine-3',5'-bis(diphosphate) 3'-pyrophosphohydrolase [Deltaproteobacteria bacterium]
MSVPPTIPAPEKDTPAPIGSEEELRFPPGYPKREDSSSETKPEPVDYKPMEGIPVYGMRAVRIHEIVDALLEQNPNADDELVNRAYVFAATAHQGMTRRSGEPYLIHPLAVAWILTDMRLDATIVTAGLLHDVVEDTSHTVEDIKREFGSDVAGIVDGLTKISKLNFNSATERAASNMRKMILAMLTDLRVILVKLADRLNNMRTLGFMPPEKQKAIAKETLDIFAPLAARLGIQKIQSELEDLSFFYLEPEAYFKLRQDIHSGRQDRQKYVEEVKAFLSARMTEFGIACEIEGRPKHLYSVWRKMREQNLPFEQIFDLVAFRIIVNEVQDCYSALGVIHSIFRPIPGRFKDYISLPKHNGYRSLHTAVVGLKNIRIEIQIRTKKMHAYAEEGIAAHWLYKEGGQLSEEETQRISSLRSVLSWQDNLSDPTSFLNSIRESLAEEDNIYVFTPQGDIKELPMGATPLDFAYSVHTYIGNHCGGAKVNGQMTSLRQKLNSADTVEIITNPASSPSRDWLRHVVTSKARARIKQWFAAAEKTQAELFGQDLLVQEMRRRRLKKSRLSKEVLRKLGFQTLDELNTAVAYGRVTVRRVMETILPELLTEPPKPPDPKTAVKEPQKTLKGVLVRGVDEVFVRYGKCCSPVRGEPIVGFLTHGNGVTIHTTNCQSIIGLDPERFIEVSWDQSEIKDQTYEIGLKVQTRPIKGGLSKIVAVLSSQVVDIIEAHTSDAKTGRLMFKVTVRDFDQYQDTIKALTELGGLVERVEREYPEAGLEIEDEVSD